MTCPPILQYAFRICFLLAAAWAAAAVPLWLLSHSGVIGLSRSYGDMNWHAHELIFGYTALVICGFLFTAIPNWTGREPLRGWPLAVLVLLWLCGRIAILTADSIGPAAAAVIDMLFLMAVLTVAAREIIAGKNWRNLRVLLLVLWLIAGNILFHVAFVSGQSTDMSLRLSIAALMALITLIGGRLTPTFTRNWLVKRGETRLPASFDRLDALGITASVIGLLTWAAAPSGMPTAILATIAAVLLTWRLWRWRGWATWREPLLLILHIGYAFIPLGFALLAVNALRPDVAPANAVTHAWTVGGIGIMTLAVMTRASLGHTGQALTADRGTILIYVAIVAAAALRIAVPFAPDIYIALLATSGIAWTIAFIGFVTLYGPLLVSSRKNAES